MSKIITSHLTVNARAEDVWAVLTDLASYSTWNPFITNAAGHVAVAERLDLTLQPPGGQAMSIRPWVTAVEEHHYLEWLGRLAMPGVFDGRHSFKLTPMGISRTLVQQSETFTGALVPFTGHLWARAQAGFVEMNHALARRTSATSGGFRHP
jgi:hypothetical protein